MGKYSTNPDVMTKDIGVVTAGTQQATPAITQPTTTVPSSSRLSTLGHTGVPGTTDPAAAVPRTDPNQMNPAGNCIALSGGKVSVLQMRTKGYKLTRDAAGKLWMCPPGVSPPADTATEEATEPGTGLGEFSWPQELQDLYRLLMGRGNDFLSEPGYSDQALSYAFGNDFEKIRQQEAGTREQMENYQSKAGMLGTGSGAQQMMDMAWGTEGDISTLMRDIFLQNEQQKRSDIGMGQNIFGTGTEFAKALEAINSARRGEGSLAMNQLLTLLQILKGGG